MTAEALVQSIVTASERWADARAREDRLENERPNIKDAAIRRLMESGAASSVTAAEKIVTKDAEYANYLEEQVVAVSARIKAYGYFVATDRRAALAAVVEVAA